MENYTYSEICLHYVDGMWKIYIHKTGKIYVINAPNQLFFDALTSQVSQDELIKYFEEHFEHNILSGRDQIGFPNLDVLQFHRRTSNEISFLDYANYNAALDIDKEDMRKLEEIEPQPDIFLNYPNCDYISLPHPSCVPPHSAISKLGFILFYNFGCLQEIKFHDHKAMLKCIPSLGARHPFEVYINDYWGMLGKKNSLYHYSVQNHAIGLIGKSKILKDKWSSPLMLEVFAVIDRYQWRYRHSLHYKELLMELGHLSNNIAATCDYLEISVDKLHNPQKKSLKNINLANFYLRGF